jgi:hypothetical protein
MRGKKFKDKNGKIRRLMLMNLFRIIKKFKRTKKKMFKCRGVI